MFALSFDDAPPSFATDFADYRTHRRFADDAVPSVASGGGPLLDAERINRRYQLGKVGVVVYSVGIGAQLVGVALLLVGSDSGDEDLMLGGAGLAVGGGIASVVGEVMLFTGGIGAAKLLGAPTTVGWVGVGLAVGAVAVSVVEVATQTDTYASSALSLGGLVCGAVQLGQAGRAGRAAGVISLHVVPVPDGFRLAGAF